MNTNTSDVAAVFQGLEAETKSFAKLKVDIDPTIALEVATKQYVDHYATYRRPVLQYNSTSTVNIETGLDGTSGDATILFPDGNLRTDSTTGRIYCNLGQVAALSGSWQSGLRTGTVANNTWYAIYAVKTTDNTSHFVTVADTVLPVQGSFSSLNSNFGSNSWVYLGLIRYGDGSATANAILNFYQAGNFTIFINGVTGNTTTVHGIRLATSASATGVTYTYAAGTGAANIPANITQAYWGWAVGGGSGTTSIKDQAGATIINSAVGTVNCIGTIFFPAVNGLITLNGSAVTQDILLAGFIDGVLGVGSNPIL